MLYDIGAKKKLLKAMLSQKRLQHSLNVADECRKLAEKYGEDPDKAYFAGLLHDICKELPAEEQKELVLSSGYAVCREELETRSLWHAIAGAYYVKSKFGEEIVYLGDLISAERDYKDVDKMRKITYISLDGAMLEAFSFSIKNQVKKNGVIPLCTVEGYNFYNRLVNEEKNKTDKK